MLRDEMLETLFDIGPKYVLEISNIARYAKMQRWSAVDKKRVHEFLSQRGVELRELEAVVIKRSGKSVERHMFYVGCKLKNKALTTIMHDRTLNICDPFYVVL